MFIEDTLSDPTQSILVHCQNGISRAPALIIAHLIQSEKIPFSEAFSAVKKSRDRIYPNAGFCAQLEKLAEVVLGGVQREAFHDNANVSHDSRKLQADDFHEGAVVAAAAAAAALAVPEHESPQMEHRHGHEKVSPCRSPSVFTCIPVSEVC